MRFHSSIPSEVSEVALKQGGGNPKRLRVWRPFKLSKRPKIYTRAREHKKAPVVPDHPLTLEGPKAPVLGKMAVAEGEGERETMIVDPQKVLKEIMNIQQDLRKEVAEDTRVTKLMKDLINHKVAQIVKMASSTVVECAWLQGRVVKVNLKVNES